MKKFVFCAALFAAITFAACSDDDESNLPVTEANIVGTWKIVHAEGYVDDGYEKETWSDDYPYTDEYGWWYWTYTFDEGGTGTHTEYDEGERPESWKLSYSISGNTLTIDEYQEGSLSDHYIYQIQSLTKSQLVLFERSDYYDDYQEEYSEEYSEETTTYKRIK